MTAAPVRTARLECPCGGAARSPVFEYGVPPEGETRFPFSEGSYRRSVVRCDSCGHFLSIHSMDTAALYDGAYVDATYGDGLRRSFERIVALDPSRSDNAGRVSRVVGFASGRAMPAGPSILDVGSGLCVFPHGMKAAGWRCTALDPDPRAARHAREAVGVEAVAGDFMDVTDLGRFDAVSFNKVLEHVADPIEMLARAHRFLSPGGFVYVEVPDGEAAVADGPGREEFFIEHHHVFSAASLALAVARAGFTLVEMERLREPSTKLTLRAFATCARGSCAGEAS